MSINELEVKRYNAGEDKEVWNNFIHTCDPYSFLFDRDFMDYHSDRFDDYSLLVIYQSQVIAVCPAHKKETVLLSHWGLTYGGVLLRKDDLLISIDLIYSAVLKFAAKNGFNSFKLKSVPEFYGKTNHLNSLKYLKDNAHLFRLDKVLAIDYEHPIKLHKTKLKHYKKNKLIGFEVREEDSFDAFWNKVLIPRLKERHDVEPVHNLGEISLLKERFPNRIKQFNIYFEGRILAGITIFDNGDTVKSQYGATTNEGERLRALEYLFIDLIYKYKNEEKQFFSMGTVMDSNFDEGFNPGLLKQKEELGCIEFQQPFYNFNI